MHTHTHAHTCACKRYKISCTSILKKQKQQQSRWNEDEISLIPSPTERHTTTAYLAAKYRPLVERSGNIDTCKHHHIVLARTDKNGGQNRRISTNSREERATSADMCRQRLFERVSLSDWKIAKRPACSRSCLAPDLQNKEKR